MKAVVFYILFLCFGLSGAHSHAQTAVHNGKFSFSATQNTVHKQQVEADNFIDVEDENDDKDIAKKFPNQAKWISTISLAFIALDPRSNSGNYLSQSRQLLHTGSQIFIEQRVLRI